MLTVVGAGGHEIGRARSGEEGRFAVMRSGSGRSRLLVVQSPGTAHAEFLTDGADHLDLDLDLDRVRGRVPAEAARAVSGDHGDADLVH